MNAPRHTFFAKLALVAGLVAHVMLPLAFAAAPATFNAASLICAPSGKVSPEADAALAEFLRLAGETAPDEPDTTNAKHCGACVFSVCAVLYSPALTDAAIYAEARYAPTQAGDKIYSSVHGPPLGLRAPPTSLKAS